MPVGSSCGIRPAGCARRAPPGCRRRCPSCRDVLLADVDLARLEGLELHGDVAIILVAHHLEIVAAAIHPEVLGPPVVDAAIGDGAADIEGIDLVGAAAERDF
jgi:hypothetical protein